MALVIFVAPSPKSNDRNNHILQHSRGQGQWGWGEKKEGKGYLHFAQEEREVETAQRSWSFPRPSGAQGPRELMFAVRSGSGVWVLELSGPSLNPGWSVIWGKLYTSPSSSIKWE